MTITFKQIDEQTINIIDDGKTVGHIFSPSGSGKDTENAIQICGFSEAFDLWGCGIFEGFKDIQLLFDGKKIEGRFNTNIGGGCLRCFHQPCNCENPKTNDIADDMVPFSNPFFVKREGMLEDRLIKKKK